MGLLQFPGYFIFLMNLCLRPYKQPKPLLSKQRSQEGLTGQLSHLNLVGAKGTIKKVQTVTADREQGHKICDPVD